MTDEDRGTTEVHGCAGCSGFAYDGEEFCPECQAEGREPVDETPL